MKIVFAFLLGLILLGCSDFEEFKGIKIRQYPTKVIRFSSELTTTLWAATQALGKENVYPNYGNNVNAWASVSADENREFLELGFDTLQTVSSIEIYETNNPGAIDSVFLRDASSKKWNLVYAKPVVKDLAQKSRIFSIFLIETGYFSDAIRMAINSPIIPGRNEIDAIAITGQRKP